VSREDWPKPETVENPLMVGSVAIASGDGAYAEEAPYSPGHVRPEYPFDLGGSPRKANPTYDRVRDVLHLLGLDVERYGQKGWNPLGEIVYPGNTVVLKPNFIRDFRETHPFGRWRIMSTLPLRGRGESLLPMLRRMMRILMPSGVWRG